MGVGLRERIGSIFIVALGAIVIILVLFAEKLGLSGSFHNSFGPVKCLGVLSGIVLVGVGCLNQGWSNYLAIWGLIVVVPLLIVDNVLYVRSPSLPKTMVAMMSSEAKMKYAFAHPEKTGVVHDGKVYYWTPYFRIHDLDRSGDRLVDEFGYCNEPGYISRIAKSQEGVDVLLLGDSFLEQGVIPMDLRKILGSMTVYSLGMGGQGIPHWGLQFERYIHSNYFFKAPRVVVLNFYAGNDITDTVKYNKDPSLPDWISNEHTKIEWPKRRFSFFHEVMSIARYVLFRKVVLPEGEIDEDPNPSELSQAFSALSLMVDKIRHVDPRTKILMSYIATPGAIYGPNEDYCLRVTHEIFSGQKPYIKACHEAVGRQARLSKELSDWSRQLNIEYVDPTMEIRETGQSNILHKFNNPHFNEEADRVYSEVVSKKIVEMLNIQIKGK